MPSKSGISFCCPYADSGKANPSKFAWTFRRASMYIYLKSHKGLTTSWQTSTNN